MHRDIVSQVVVAGEYLVTASVDGHLKFWRRAVSEAGSAQPVNAAGIVEFLKSFRAHAGPVTDLVASPDGRLVVSLSVDQTVKIFDVQSFDMLLAAKLDFVPAAACWTNENYRDPAILVADKDSGSVWLLEGLAEHKLHISRTYPTAVDRLCSDPARQLVVSVQRSGRIDIWSPDGGEESVGDGDGDVEQRLEGKDNANGSGSGDAAAKSKEDHLDDLQKCGATALSLVLSPDGDFFCIMGSDRNIRVYRTRTGRLYRKYDESLEHYQRLYDDGRLSEAIDGDDFARRLALERDLEKTSYFACANCVYDETGNFILFATPLGIKVLNLTTNKVPFIVGSGEAQRFVGLAMFQGSAQRKAMTLEMAASQNPALIRESSVEAFVACTAFRKNRFYLFTKDAPAAATPDRDVLNERSAQDESGAAKTARMKRLPAGAILRTTLGDIHMELFGDQAPLAVENFTTHAKNGYYDNLLFHRVIKGFMIQTGDPLGDGTGGESIWGGEFRDEFHESLRHDQPYTISLANAGRNTNGSQFFITTVKCPWLDGKHTIFGRVTRGKDVVHAIEQVATEELDRPANDVKIVQIEIVK